MKTIIISGLSVIAAFTQAHAEYNCCGKCPYGTSASVCTENCCHAKYGVIGGQTRYSDPDNNGVITITKYTDTVTCATSASGSNFVRCGVQNSYICAQGYYGSPTLLNKTCTKCPSSGGVAGTTTGTGATKITECYIPAGTAFSDTTGAGTYSENCYYSE
ncbi:MAG: hypothetical protein K2L25_03470 [Alphaproteobacteria bacterium]|nr:hypothetical protein [Alphaproteobacteria bacterium]